MADHPAVPFRDERYREGPGRTQCGYDKWLGVIADLPCLYSGVTSVMAFPSAAVSLLVTIFGSIIFCFLLFAGYSGRWPVARRLRDRRPMQARAIGSDDLVGAAAGSAEIF